MLMTTTLMSALQIEAVSY